MTVFNFQLYLISYQTWKDHHLETNTFLSLGVTYFFREKYGHKNYIFGDFSVSGNKTYPLRNAVGISGLSSSCSNSRTDARWLRHSSNCSWRWLAMKWLYRMKRKSFTCNSGYEIGKFAQVKLNADKIRTNIQSSINSTWEVLRTRN